ncbi:MAG TPA: iron-containing alcohol dehydrogenase family protein [Acidimicrobiales bacterium]|nr:iron-containing alcohol dehydrogenase family protein [Acidimicrobiales bacterium]
MTKSFIHTGYAQQIIFGVDAVDRVAEVLKSIGLRRVLLVTTQGRMMSDAGIRLHRVLGRSAAVIYDDVRSHVPTDTVQEASELARRERVDGIVSFGGGSCADTGKAVAFFAEQAEGVPGTSHVDRPVLPHVSIPTTYSGAELTPFFGMTDTSTKQKTGAGGPTTAPVVAVYDPKATLDMPPDISAETAMNALAHGVEAVYSPRCTPEAEAIALESIRRIATSIPRVVEDPDDLDARTDMLAGAALAGRCLQNSSMGIHHALAQMIGGRSGIPHGRANAVLLSKVVAFNELGAPDAIRRIGEALGDPADAAGAVDRLRARLGLPDGLAAAGVSDDDIAAVAQLAPQNFLVQNNVRRASADEIEALLASAR